MYTEELYFVTFVVISYFPAEDSSNTSSENYRTWSPDLKKIISLPGEEIWRSSKKFLRTNERTSKRACGSSCVYMYMAAGVFMRTERTPRTCVTWRKMVRHIRNENAVEGNWKSKLRSGTTKRQRAALDVILRQIRKSLCYNWHWSIVYAIMEWLELKE